MSAETFTVENCGHRNQFRIVNDPKLEDFDDTYLCISGFFGSHGPHVFAAAPELLAELRDARTELSLTRTNIMVEMGKSAGAAYRWEGVPELMKQRLDKMDVLIAKALGQEGGAL